MSDDVTGGGPAAQASTRALDRGLQLLTSLAEESSGLSAPELAERNGLSRATVYRLLATLVGRGFVTSDPHTRRYWLGPAVERWFFGRESRLTLAALAGPEMAVLADTVGESIGLHVRNGAHRVAIGKVEPQSQALRYVSPIGVARDLASGASGAALMTDLTDDEIAKAVAGRATPEVPGTHQAGLDEIIGRVRQARQRGYCEAVAETVPGIASVATPLLNSDGRVLAALVISGPSSRFGDAERSTAAKHLIASAGRVARMLTAT